MKKEDFNLLLQVLMISIVMGLFAFCGIVMMFQQTTINDLREKVKILEFENITIKNNCLSSTDTRRLKSEDFYISEVSAFDVQNINLAVRLNLSENDLETLIFFSTTEERFNSIKPYIPYIIEASEITGVNELFLTSLIAWESGWGSNITFGNNLYGWQGGTYESLEQSIIDIAIKIKDRYLTEGGSCFHGYCLPDINKKYNGSHYWLNGMTDIMLSLYQSFDFL